VNGSPAVALPLDGVKVLDLSRLLPGGFCSQLLADLGADVVKVEDTGAGDYMRLIGPCYEGSEVSVRSALFLAVNRNKRSIRLDLKTKGGREALLALVRDADVLLESFRPGVLERLGLGYDVLSTINERIVYCAITGYGLDGPNTARAGHDINYLALSGLLALTGERDGPPVSSAGQIADVGGGALMAFGGILAALRERDGTPSAPGSGLGQIVDVSMFDGALSWMALPAAESLCEGRPPRRGEFVLGGGAACYRPYRCMDGWVAMGAFEAKFWSAWCDGVGRPDLLSAQFAAPGSVEHREIEAIFAQRTRAQWHQFADEIDCCLEPVLEIDEALESELVGARGMVIEIDQPDIDGSVRLVGPPLKLSRTPADPHRLPAPALGAHTREILAAAGYEDGSIDELIAGGAIAEARAPSS
jgi:alpha-methylacyl-CoA racemase